MGRVTTAGLIAALSLFSSGLGYVVSRGRAPSEQAPMVAGHPSGMIAEARNEETSEDENGYRLSALSVFSNVALHVKDHYVDPSRIEPEEMLEAALEEVERQIAEVMVQRTGPEEILVSVMDQKKPVKLKVQSLWEINLELRDVFRFLEKHLPPQEDIRQIEYAAVNGALSTLDPHSILLRPEAFAEMKTSTKGEFGGLGIVISVKDGKLTVISPISDTPAARAGLEAGDIITRIGDVSTVSMPVEEAVRLLRGPKGSKATIFVSREGWRESKRFEIVRERIKLESVESELLSQNVGYIKIKNFQQNTGRDLEEQLRKLEKNAGSEGLRGLVLDLRNNPGGLLEQATRVSDQFLSSGDIVTTVGYGNKLREPKRAHWSGTKSKLPVAVLVNRGSASASEIVAGALKNLDRATIIGETTFGKGSVQVLYDFADSSALKLTIAQYLTPGDLSIQNEGVQPDISLLPSWVKENQVRMFYRDEQHREAALKKHLERAAKAAKKEPSQTVRYSVRKNDKPEEDFPVEFAREYLVAAGTAKRSSSLRRGRRFVANQLTQEEVRISHSLAEIEIDWTAQPKKDRSPPTLHAQLNRLGPTQGPVRGGDVVKLQGQVTNRGSAIAYRVHGWLESDNSAFQGRELMFGKLQPGETRNWVVETRLPLDSASRTDTVTLVLSTDEQKLEASAILDVKIDSSDRPRFALTWSIDDLERGDGDGILEAGEGIDLRVLVKNQGRGKARDISLRLKSAAKDDIYLERGRSQLGALEPGGMGVGTLQFKVSKSPERTAVPLEVDVYDAETGAWLDYRFEIPVKKQTERRMTSLSGWRNPSRQVPVLASAEDSARALGTLPAKTMVWGQEQHGKYTKIPLTEDMFGFIESSELERSKKKVGDKKLLTKPITWSFDAVAPTIDLDQNLSGLVTPRDRVEIRGSIKARSIRDMYILVNGDKVFFKRGMDLSEPSPDGVRVLKFKSEVELDTGLNKVVVVARSNETLLSHRTLYLARRPEAAVASKAD